MMNTKTLVAAVLAVFAGLATDTARAQTIITDNFTGASSTYNWAPFNGACLTAGDGTGTIPKCSGLAYYGSQLLVGGNSGTLPDNPSVNGSPGGALRFTNGFPGGYAQSGAVVSNFTFPTDQGLEVTFTTVTYRGDSGGGGRDGADGISFFLMDGGYQPDLGAFGGSLGYTCSNSNNDPTRRLDDGTPRGYDGLVGGYIGLGIDEYGNFLNQGDNTASGYGYQPGRIGIRGAGSVAWRWLNNNFPTQYPSSLTLPQRARAVQKTCRSGQIWDFSADPTGLATTQPTTPAFLDYPAIPNAFKVLPNTLKIANESAATRAQAIPITYKLKITTAGLLSFSYSYNAGAYQSVIAGQDITSSNGTLPKSFRFGFAGSTGGSTNIHEIMCFQATPSNQSSSSAGINEKQTAKIQTGNQVYFAFYNPETWAGSVTANDLIVDKAGNLTINTTARWDASCVLTGVLTGQSCLKTGVSGPTAAEAPNSRSILTWNGAKGIPFRWNNLTNNQQIALTAGDASANANRLQYLRGDRSNEIDTKGVGLYRARPSVLGDIIGSSPGWVGPPSGPYGAVWQDKLFAASAPENSGQSYPTFATSARTRTNVVYSGANDGLLHGYRSGAYTAANVYDTATTINDGLEVLAYMPGAVLNVIHDSVNSSLDFSNAQYGHNFFVDAPPGSGDLFYAGAWHTWLVGGLGSGGSAIYALDVTNPANFSETNAASLVVGEWTNSTITCVNDAACGQSLGDTFGIPVIRRFHNGSWGAVFGNGMESANGDAGVFVMIVDPTSGAQTFYYLSTGTAGNNGISFATPADFDGDHVVDYIYAGDVRGNIWRFDVTSNDPTKWKAEAAPLFSTPGGQPISTKVLVASVPIGAGPPRVLVEFGTGQQTLFTNTAAAQYATGSQSLYGIWDWDMNRWNAKMSLQYATLAGPQTIIAGGTNSNLQAQTVTGTYPAATTGAGTAYRTVSNTPVCWQNSTQCGTSASANTQFGWYLTLPTSSEQVIFSPILEVGAFIVNTTIPGNNSPTTCNSTQATGWTMAISPSTGGAFKNSFFFDANHNLVNVGNQMVSGVALSGTGSPSIVNTMNKTFLVSQTVSGAGTAVGINPPGGTKGDRLTWIQRR